MAKNPDSEYSKEEWTKLNLQNVQGSTTKDNGNGNGNGNGDKKEEGGSYTVKSGNTLSQIAKDNNTTVEELMKKNPDIKNKNVINTGQTINL